MTNPHISINSFSKHLFWDVKREKIDVDFVNYSYPWLQDEIVINGIRLAHKVDIAAMKIAAITGRGSRKDFADLYFLLKKMKLSDIIS